MSFTIRFYTNSSDNIVASKSLTPLGVLEFADFRGDYDVYNPLLLIQTDDQTSVKDLLDAYYPTFAGDVMSGKINYFYIPASGRYYYLTARKMVQDNIVALKLHEDVLKTRIDVIRTCEGIVRRNENTYNLYIPDEKIHTYANPIVRRKLFNGSAAFAPSTPTTVGIFAGFRDSLTQGDEFAVTVTRIGNPNAANGGACVYFPLFSSVDVAATNPTIDAWRVGFTVSRTNDLRNKFSNTFVIAPLSAYYGPYYESQSQSYNDEGFCIAYMTNTRVGQHDEYICDIVPVKTFSYGTTIRFLGPCVSPNFPNINFTAWSIGGSYDQALQGSGASCVINGVVMSPATSMNFSPIQTCNTGGTPTIDLKFYSKW